MLPHVSSMQLAFARVKETWEEAYLTNLQTHPLETVLDRIRTAETVGLFPSENEGPPEVARSCWPAASIISASTSARTSAVPTSASPRANCSEIQDMEFAPLNVMILKRKPGRPDRPATAAALSAASAIPTTCSPRAGPRAA